MWNKIVKKDNSTLPPEKEQVIFLTSKGDIFTGWREELWASVKKSWGICNYRPRWFISGTKGKRYECTTGVLYWMSIPALPDDFN